MRDKCLRNFMYVTKYTDNPCIVAATLCRRSPGRIYTDGSCRRGTGGVETHPEPAIVNPSLKRVFCLLFVFSSARRNLILL